MEGVAKWRKWRIEYKTFSNSVKFIRKILEIIVSINATDQRSSEISALNKLS